MSFCITKQKRHSENTLSPEILYGKLVQKNITSIIVITGVSQYYKLGHNLALYHSILLTTILYQYPNHDHELEIHTGYNDSMDILIPSS